MFVFTLAMGSLLLLVKSVKRIPSSSGLLMGEGLQARPNNASGSAVREGSDLEVLTHYLTIISRQKE